MDDRLQQLIALGRQHYNAEEYVDAERFLTQVVEAEPNFPDIYNMLGVIYHAAGRFADAETAFARALELNPSYTEAALNLSVTLNDRGKYDQARDVYNRAMTKTAAAPRQLDPFARGKLANMHADIGEVYASMGLYDEAVREYSRALEMCPEFVDLRTKLGNVYRDMGMYNAAIAQFQRAIEQRPDYTPARIFQGIALFSLSRKDDAIAAWKRALELEPDNKSAALYLRMVGDRGEASETAVDRNVVPLPDDTTTPVPIVTDEFADDASTADETDAE